MGQSEFMTGPGRKRQDPFVWRDGVVTDLSDAFYPGNYVQLGDDVGIDAQGRINLSARVPHGPAHAILLVPRQ